MQSQLNCPQCGTPFSAPIVQVIDVDQMPQIKQYLLSGQLNVAQCPSCGWSGQIGTPLVYHDSAHELFMVFIPSELNLPHMEEQQLIGQLTRAIVENTPMEKRKMYMLQPPMQIMRWQTFIEKVLETEGVTKEMLEAQQRQADLLQNMISADPATRNQLIADHGDELDETAFAMLRQALDAAGQGGDNDQWIRLTNLQAHLMADTVVGQKIEKQQMAVHGLNMAAKANDGLTPQILLDQVLANKEDDDVVDALVGAGQSALSYEFFSLLSAEIEDSARQHDKETVKILTAIRTRLLAIYDEMRAASEQVIKRAAETLQTVLSAPDKRQALMEHVNELDETFTYVLSANMEQAEKTGNQAAMDQLVEIQEALQDLAMEQVPPEIRMINDVIMAPSETEARRILNENSAMVTPELAEAIKQLIESDQTDPAMKERLHVIQGMIDAKLALRI